jgi:hypothetical protein
MKDKIRWLQGGWGLNGSLIGNKILDLWQAKNGLRPISRWRVNNAEKSFTLFHCIEKLQHFEISFNGKINAKYWFFAILRRTPVAMVTGNLRMSLLLQRLWCNQHMWKFHQYWSIFQFYSSWILYQNNATKQQFSTKSRCKATLNIENLDFG